MMLRWGVVLVGLLVLAAGAALTYGGGRLLLLGGSAYYLAAGIGLLGSGLMLLARRTAGLWLFLIVFVGTIIWAFAEAGFDYWALFPRIFASSVLLLAVLLVSSGLREGPWRFGAIPEGARRAMTGLVALEILGIGALGFMPHGVIVRDSLPMANTGSPSGAAQWRYIGGAQGGTRYSPHDQIAAGNVKDLKVAWTLRTGDVSGEVEGRLDESTPIQIGDSLFTCTPNNQILAIDAQTGRLRWRYDPKVKPGVPWRKCRGVSYYRIPGAARGQCHERIIFNTLDTRLIALDAVSGKLCVEFGENGAVDLRQGMGEVPPGHYFQTSPPTIAKGLVVVGGWVADNIAVNMPGGVIRAFSAITGELVWAWDPGNPLVVREPLDDGEYTRGTPNSWSIMSVDEKLGLVYFPTGNATPDFWGANRRPGDDAHSSSVIALDIETGRLRWKFQTVHHDLWDYDVASQPLLYDIPDDKGGAILALVQLTKQGQIYLLNRKTGEPVTQVEERPVPQGGMPGERLAPTQPFSVGMPSSGTEPLSESAMWGLTPLDQLWCRIGFRQHRYEGTYTPPTLQRSILYPGAGGGYNWGSGAIDEKRGLLIVNDIRLAFFQRLVSRSEYDRTAHGPVRHFIGMFPNEGARYASDYGYFMSPIGMPCNPPPFGTLKAIDLRTHRIVWQRPAGTIRDMTPLGVPLPLGLATLGGPLVTGSGLVFYSGTQDRYLRALDTRNGTEIWKARLPVGSVAAPMSYIAGNGRQYILVNAGGSVPVGSAPVSRGDYLIAYALP